MKFDIHSDVSALNYWKPSHMEDNKEIGIQSAGIISIFRAEVFIVGH